MLIKIPFNSTCIFSNLLLMCMIFFSFSFLPSQVYLTRIERRQSAVGYPNTRIIVVSLKEVF